MKTAGQIRREAKQLFRWCLVDGRLDDNRVRQVVRRILDDKRRGYMALLEQYERLVKLECDRHTADIESAVPLPADLRDRINADLEHLYGTGLEIRVALSPELIAGMRIKVGSDVYDGSIRYRLATLQNSFSIGTADGGNA